MRIKHLLKTTGLFYIFLIALYGYSQENGQSFFITANTGDTDNQNTLKQIVHDAESTNNSTLLILGNIVSKEGNVGKNSGQLLNKQLSVIDQFNGNIIVTPGNNEWKVDGYKGVERTEKFIQKNSKAEFYPNKGFPLKKVHVSDNIDIIIIDSQWYLEDWDKYPYINENSEMNNRKLFYFELLSLLKKSEGKTKIILIHHPITTNTRAGLLHKTGGISLQDFENKQYRDLRNRVTTIARQFEDVIFVSGHDKNLQLIDYYGIPQIISGSPDSGKKAKTKREGDFAVSNKGYTRLDIDKNGQASVHFYEVNNGTSKVIFSKIIAEAKTVKPIVSYKDPGTFKKYKSASVYSKKETDKSKFFKFIWGEHYRNIYSKQVSAQVVLLDTFMGGLTPIRRGGGKQSNSLRLEDKNGKQYVMRAIRKNAIKFIQTAAFKDKYVQEKLKETSFDNLMLDFFTTAHPYTPFAVAELSDAVGVNYTNPKLYYVPKQESLGKFNDTYGDELYLIEERVEPSHIDLENFGKPDDIISTEDLLKEIYKNGKSHVDEASYIRARLFDILIGDWDRHEDQWRWARFTNSDGTIVYKPIPRDRDQAFSKFDGNLISFLRFAVAELKMFQSFDQELKNVNWFTAQAYSLDMIFINSSGWDEWEKQARYVQNNLTNEVISQAFDEIPEEIKGKTIDEIKLKLQGRRENLVKIAKEYYEYLNKTEILIGTQKKDVFTIKRLANGKTNIHLDRKDVGIFERTYTSDITKEIWIYGLDGKDEFKVLGKGDNLIKIKIIGGKKNDVYDFKNIHKVKLYDYKSKKNTIVNSKSKKWLVDSYEISNYDFKKKKYYTNHFFPILGANPDDGFKIGFENTLTKFGLQRNPFTNQHKISANYYFGNSGYDVAYTGEFSNFFHKWNFGIEGLYTSPNFSMNYFGSGNETEYDKDLVDLDYNRVRIRKWAAAIALIWRGRDGGSFHFKPLLESFNVDNTDDRFISDVFPPDSNVFKNQDYAGAEITYKFKNKNSASFPTLALDVGITAGYKAGINENSDDNSFAYVEPYFGLIYVLTPSKNLVLATRIGGEAILGDNFEFYHGATLGGSHGLRGYRNERFNGKYSLYHNIDLRLRLGKSKASFLPLKYGLTAGFDYGRVWVEDDDSNKWHNNIGGSFWVSGFEAFTGNIGYYHSTEGGRVSFTLGFEF